MTTLPPPNLRGFVDIFTFVCNFFGILSAPAGIFKNTYQACFYQDHRESHVGEMFLNMSANGSVWGADVAELCQEWPFPRCIKP